MTLYSSLLAMLVIQIVVAMNEEVIFLVSARGTVWNDKPRRWLSKLLYLRMVLFVMDVATLVYATWSVFNEGTVTQLAPCASYSSALRFAKGIVAVIWITLVIYAVSFLIFLDPCGCFSSTSLIDELHFNDDQKQVDGQWTSGQRRKFRRLRILCSLFCVKETPKTTIALWDLARTMQKIFYNVNLVPSDIVAGFLLLRHDQKRKLKTGGVAKLTTPLREVMTKCKLAY